MSMAELMREAANLPPERQDELAAYLLDLRLKRDPAWRTKLTRRIDDKNPDNWVTLEEWKKELSRAKE
jgi:hypothetical protein